MLLGHCYYLLFLFSFIQVLKFYKERCSVNFYLFVIILFIVLIIYSLTMIYFCAIRPCTSFSLHSVTKKLIVVCMYLCMEK